MRHLVLLLALSILLCTVPSFAESKGEHNLYSRSFTVFRPVYDLIEVYHHLIDPMQYNPDNAGTPQALFVYQHTRDHDLAQSKFARYFLINGKNQLLVAGDSSDLACKRDVRAEW